MRTILLTQGKVALVDDADYAALAVHKWSAVRKKALWYATRSVYQDDRCSTITMHREILGLKKGEVGVDHVDGDGLNNQRANLRHATRAQNAANRGTQCNNSIGFKGVSRHHTRWRACIRVNQQLLRLGRFDTPEEAARAYDAAAIKYFGEFAYLNEVGHGREAN